MIILFADNNIYKKPSEIPFNFSNNISGIADYCLLKDGISSFKFIAINKPLSSVNSWNQYPVLDQISVAGISFQSEILIFSYDASNGRKGNIKDLQKIITLCHIPAIKNFISNAIEILNFHVDRWDTEVLVSMLRLTEEKSQKVGINKKETKRTACNLPFFTAIQGETISWAELKRFQNLHIAKDTPLSYLFRTSLINAEVFSFCNANEIVYIYDVIDSYIEFANYTAFKDDTEDIEAALKLIILYSSQKGWLKLFSGDEPKDPFTAKRTNIDKWISSKARLHKEKKQGQKKPTEISLILEEAKLCKKQYNTSNRLSNSSKPSIRIRVMNTPPVIKEDRRNFPGLKKDNKPIVEEHNSVAAQQEEFAEKQKGTAQHLTQQQHDDSKSDIKNDVKNLKNNVNQINTISDSSRRLIEKYVDNRFVRTEYLYDNCIIDKETYDFLVSNTFTSFHLLLVRYDRFLRLKKKGIISDKSIKQIEALIDFAINKRWISGV